MNLSKILFSVLLLVFLFSFTSATYTFSDPNLISGGTYSAFKTSTGSMFDTSYCQEGQDFVLRVSPEGCMPVVVRSDLLEEQDVPVYCPIQALKVNPLMDISSINKIDVYPEGEQPRIVGGVNFFPNHDAIRDSNLLDGSGWTDLGYALIYLNQEENESNMPEYAKGSLRAKINYDLVNAYGLREHTFYLPLITDLEFEEQLGSYSFFNHMGYIRADSIDSNSATISLYSDLNRGSFFSKSQVGDVAKQKLTGYNLNVGETSSELYLPGLSCLSSVSFTLDSVEVADTYAKLKINSEVFQLREGQNFMGGLCTVVSEPEKVGLRESVRINCREDEGGKTTILTIAPSIKLKIGDKVDNYQLGDYLYDSGDMRVYLAYAGTDEKTGDIEVGLMGVSGTTLDKLSESYISSAIYIHRGKKLDEVNAGNLILKFSSTAYDIYKSLGEGENYQPIDEGEEKELFGKKVSILGFGDVGNLVFTNKSLEEYYKNAVESYETVYKNYKGTKYDGFRDLSKQALNDLIVLQNTLSQRRDMKTYCQEFLSSYSDEKSLEAYDLCNNEKSIANEGISSRDVVIDGKHYEIIFDGVYKPDLDDYSAVISIWNGTEYKEIVLGKDSVVDLGSLFSQKASGETIKLVEIKDEKNVIVDTNSLLRQGFSSVVQGTESFITNGNRNLELNSPNSFGSRYTFRVDEINLERVAVVKLNPNINYAGTEAVFNYTIGIEKRGIKLSPEMTKDLIESTKKLNEQLESISGFLDGTVKTFKSACLSTGILLTVKNFILGSNGEAIAREEVMQGENGWRERCGDLIPKEYDNHEQCYLDNAGKIDSEVDLVIKAMDEQDKIFENIQKESGVVDEEGNINPSKLYGRYATDVSSELDVLGDKFSNPDPESKDSIDISKIKNVLKEDAYGEVYDSEAIKDVGLYLRLREEAGDEELRAVYDKRLYTSLKGIDVNADKYLKKVQADEEAKNLGYDHLNTLIPQKLQKEIIFFSKDEFATANDPAGIPKDTPIQRILTSIGEQYVVTLEGIEGGQFVIKDVYNMKGEKVTNKEELESIRGEFKVFQKVDSNGFQNEIKNPEIKYYETAPYRGLPAVVPFDVKEGWYAYVEQSYATLGSSGNYDKSGRVNSFWLCNVGSNRLIDFSLLSSGDDTCQLINLGYSQTYQSFANLGPQKIASLVNSAQRAIETASIRHTTGIDSVDIIDPRGNSVRIDVGSPAVSVDQRECSDYMSPSDCKLLFNVCDPVICPRSRCDFGGEYPVQNVVQSGIIGSTLLCLPNVNEGIYVPVCLTGVKAGVDGLRSVTESYQSCLQESLDSGQTVGICDEIQSVYLCEFLWKQAIPLAGIAAPEVLKFLFEAPRGGGEYLNIEAALQNADDSFDYFTQYYALDSYNAFKARSQAEVGTDICKKGIYGVFPTGQGAFNNLIEGDSPPQFTANFDEIEFSSATNPPTSHYKVFYHIYSGEDSGVYYQVYLRAGGSSYYKDNPTIPVSSGYIDRGGYKTETVDRTWPSGYTQLCVRVNEQEECGFGEVSTDFALNYLKEAATQSEIENTDITSQEECVSGSASFYDLLSLNLQGGIEDAINPNIYAEGIIRVCATSDPDADDTRWKPVGNCGSPEVGCYIDTKSIEGALKWASSREESLSEIEEASKDAIAESKNLLSESQFADRLISISEETNPFNKIALIDDTFKKVFLNDHKSYLTYLLGETYNGLAIDLARELGLFNRGGDPPEKVIPPTIDEDQFKDYTSNIYNYFEKSTNSGETVEINYCYQFKQGTWYRAQKLQDGKCGEFDVAVGSVVNGKGFIEGIGILVERVKQDPENRHLSAGAFTLGEDFLFTLNKQLISFEEDDMYFYLRYSLTDNFWQINFENGDGFLRVRKENLPNEEFTHKNLILNLTDKNLAQGSIVLFEGKGFNFKLDGTSPPGDLGSLSYGLGDLTLTQAEINQLNEEDAFVLKTKTESNYEYSFVYLSGKGWFVKNKYYIYSNVAGEPSQSSSESSWIGINYGDFEDNIQYEEVLKLVESLKGESYFSGLKKIIESSSGELNSGRFSFLRHKDVSSSLNGDLVISNLPEIDKLYFKFLNNHWVYGFDGDTWYELTDIRQKPKSGWWIFGSGPKEMTKEQKDFLVSLRKVSTSKYDGALKIFLYGEDVSALSVFDSSSCSDYYPFIKEISEEKGVDPYLVLALILQESSCNSFANSENPKAGFGFDEGASYGLMQISGRTWCGEFGLSSDPEICKANLMNDPEKNIRVGIEILLDGYSKGPVNYKCSAFESKNQNEPEVDKFYTGWEAALRRYNGIGCAKIENGVETFADHGFVEEVLEKMTALKQTVSFDGSLSGGDEENPPTTDDTTTTQTISWKIYSIAKDYADRKIDFYRGDEDNKDYSNVCASFVSTVVYEAGARADGLTRGTGACQSVRSFSEILEGSSNFTRVDFDKLEKGDILIFGNPNAETNPYVHAAIFSNYEDKTKTTIEAYGDPGSEGGPVQLQSPKTIKSDNSWFLNRAYRYVGPEESTTETEEETTAKATLNDYNNAIKQLKGFDLGSKYSDHKKFVDDLYNGLLITEEQYDDINGGIFNIGQKDMNYILNILYVNKIRDFGPEDSTVNEKINLLGRIISYLPDEGYINNEENHPYLRDLLSYGIMSVNEFEFYTIEKFSNAWVKENYLSKKLNELKKLNPDSASPTNFQCEPGNVSTILSEECWNFQSFIELVSNNPSLVNRENLEGKTALFYVAEFDSLLEMKTLIEDYNADYNHLDNKQQNLLHYAARYNSFDMVEYLVGLNYTFIGVSNSEGTIPKELAKYNSKGEGEKIINYLRERELSLILEGKLSVPFFDECELGEAYCSKYTRMLAERLFGYNYFWSDAWCRAYLDNPIKTFDSNDISNNQVLLELLEEGTVEPGMIVAVYYPFTDTGLIGTKDDCDGRISEITIEYTHNLLYLGKNPKGEHTFAELFYHSGPSLRTFDSFSDSDAQFIVRAIVSPKGV